MLGNALAGDTTHGRGRVNRLYIQLDSYRLSSLAPVNQSAYLFESDLTMMIPVFTSSSAPELPRSPSVVYREQTFDKSTTKL